MFFRKNLGKVWDLEEIWDIAKFIKMKAKNDRVPTFSMSQTFSMFFRWTQLFISVCNNTYLGLEINPPTYLSTLDFLQFSSLK